MKARITPREVIALCREKDVKAVALRFCDLWGTIHEVAIPVGKLTEELFESGIGIDGALPGWQAAIESDLLLVPKPDTAFLDPLASVPTLVILSTVREPLTQQEYPKDPRGVLERAVEYFRGASVATTCAIGLALEFFLTHPSSVESNVEPLWKGPTQTRTRFDFDCLLLESLHSSGMNAQRVTWPDPKGRRAILEFASQAPLRAADDLAISKDVVRKVAKNFGLPAVMMAKPFFEQTGAGLGIEVSIYKNGEPLLAGNGYGGMSEVGLHAIGGVLRHGAALAAFTNPTTNSYRRIASGDTPEKFGYSVRNRSAAVRIPVGDTDPRQRRFEIRFPDPTANPYLAIAAVIMAVADGVQNKLGPGKPLGSDPSKPNGADLGLLPKSLDDSLAALEADHSFLMRGDVFTSDLINSWITHKRTESLAIRSRPHPHEWLLYADL